MFLIINFQTGFDLFEQKPSPKPKVQEQNLLYNSYFFFFIFFVFIFIIFSSLIKLFFLEMT
jgi:hypothetical protein